MWHDGGNHADGFGGGVILLLISLAVEKRENGMAALLFHARRGKHDQNTSGDC